MPGQSTLGEVRQVVSNDSFIPSHEIEEDVDGSRTIFYWWGRLNEIGYDHAGRFVVNNGVLSSIEITPNLDFTLEQILNIYGEPTATEAQFEVWRSPWILFVNLYLYYPSNGLVAEFKFRATEDYPASREAYSLYPEIPGRGFALYRPAESIEGFASSAYGLAGQELQSWLDSIVLGWPGYESAVMMHPDARSHWDSPLIITMTPDQNTER